MAVHFFRPQQKQQVSFWPSVIWPSSSSWPEIRQRPRRATVPVELRPLSWAWRVLGSLGYLDFRTSKKLKEVHENGGNGKRKQQKLNKSQNTKQKLAAHVYLNKQGF